MAAEVITGASIVLNSVDLSTMIKKVEVRKTFEVKEKNGFQDAAVFQQAGIAKIQIDIDWYGDYAASGVYDTIFSLLGLSTTYAIKKDSGADATDNPAATGSVIVTDFPFIAAENGEFHEFSTSWPGDGDWVIDVTP